MTEALRDRLSLTVTTNTGYTFRQGRVFFRRVRKTITDACSFVTLEEGRIKV